MTETSVRDTDHTFLQNEDPLNVETRSERLRDSFLTRQSDFYIRCHGDVPSLPDDHPITIVGVSGKETTVSVADLKARFKTRTIAATLQCAGNRRQEMQAIKMTTGDGWGIGAIGNAEWTGVALEDVLDEISIDPSVAHVAFHCADAVTVAGKRTKFGISIPIEKALHADTLLAWAMNGEPLSPEHGAPLRLVAPGYAGVRNAKWVETIELRSTPCEAPTQSRDYKHFHPSVSEDEADWDAALTINEMPVNSAICVPCDGASLQAGPVRIAGYAIAYGRAVARVDVSGDGGTTWRSATIDETGTPWTWIQWSAEFELEAGRHELVVRAVDDAGQGQPDSTEGIWNFAGYLCTSSHRIHVTVA